MKRRDLLRTLGTGAGVAGLTATGLTGCVRKVSHGGPSDRPEITWRLVSSFPRSVEAIFSASERFAARVNQLTAGRFTIRLFPAGELVPGLQVLDAVSAGTAQMGHSASYYYVGKDPAFAFDSSLPFGMGTRAMAAWFHWGGGREALAPLFEKFNVVSFQGGSTGGQMGGWFRPEIHTPDDLKGLKLRFPGLGGEVMAQMGATVQVLAGGDIFPALERGVIDGAEWSGPYDDEKLGFHRIVKNYYYPGWQEPGPTLNFYVNRTEYLALPKDYQAAIECAAHETHVTMTADYDAKNPVALARLKNDGVIVRPLPPEVLKALKQAALAVYEAKSAQSPIFKSILGPYLAFKKQTDLWLDITDQAYGAFKD
jgi:TRAP-type mannitol/chloroaromatic compound transport system substrate-binding protein